MAGGVDTGRLVEKAAYLKAQLEALRRHTADPEELELLLGDGFASGAVKYALQTAVEAVIDTAYHLAAKMYGQAPGSAAEAFRVLAANRLLTGDEAERLGAMARFGNKVVHGYGEITAEGLRQILREDLAAFEAWLEVLGRVVTAEEESVDADSGREGCGPIGDGL